MIYDVSHTNPMEWDEFQKIVDDLIDKLEKMNIVFDAVVPVMRSGMIPATMIANKLKITTMIPVQVKYSYNPTKISVITPPQCPENTNKIYIKNILVVESNTGSGRSASRVRELLGKEFPDAVLHYVTVTKVFTGCDSFDGYETAHVGRLTNEGFRDDAPENARYGITIFPWETAEYELEDINA